METKIVVCFFNEKNTDFYDGTATEHTPTSGFDEVKTSIDAGWILDKRFKNSGIITLNDVAIYHLVKLTEEEHKQPSLLTEAEPKVTDLISVNLDEVDAKLKEGWELLDRDHVYAKTAVLVKRTKSIVTIQEPTH